MVITKLTKDLEKSNIENANAIVINELEEEEMTTTTTTTIALENSKIINYDKKQDLIENYAKDNRLDQLNIPKGLIESLHNVKFTIEMILNSTPSYIAEVLGIDYYVAQIIQQETKSLFDNNNKIILNL